MTADYADRQIDALNVLLRIARVQKPAADTVTLPPYNPADQLGKLFAEVAAARAACRRPRRFRLKGVKRQWKRKAIA